jgi:hypothetical protein
MGVRLFVLTMLLISAVIATAACQQRQGVTSEKPEHVYLSATNSDGGIVLTYREKNFDVQNVPIALEGKTVRLMANSKIKDTSIEFIIGRLSKANVKVIDVQMPSSIPSTGLGKQ